MRSTRLLSSLLLALSLVTVAPLARAEDPPAGGEAPAPGDPRSNVFTGSHEHERPTIGSKEAPKYAQGKRPTVNGMSRSTEPIVAHDKNGNPYDKRNGRKLSAAQAAAADKWAAGYDAKPQVDLISGDTGEKSAGLNAGPFKDGRVVLADGKYGSVNLDVGRVSGQGSYSAGITKDGLQAQANLQGQATLIGINGETGTAQLGDPNGLNNASIKGEGQAYIGAEGSLDGHLGVTKNGIGGGGTAEVFAGGKVEGKANAVVTICGIEVDLQGEASASYGIGAKASGQFSIDWSKMSVKIGGSASLTVGGGAGVGGTMEISLAKLLKNPGAAAECVASHLAEAAKYVAGKVVDVGKAGIKVLGDGVNAVTSTLGNAGHAVSSFFGGLFGGDDPKPTAPVAVASSGNNSARNASTTPNNGKGLTSPGGEQHGINRN